MQIPEFLNSLGYGSKRGRGCYVGSWDLTFSPCPLRKLYIQLIQNLSLLFAKNQSLFKQWRILHHFRWNIFYIGLCSALMAWAGNFIVPHMGMKRNFLLIGADPGHRDCKGVIPWRNSAVLVSMSYRKFWIYWVGVNTKLILQCDKT